MDVLDIARIQFGVITVYHFLFVPLTIGGTALVALLETLVAAHRQPRLPPADEVLRQAAADQLRDRRGDRDRPGVPVRDELVGLLALRRRRLRRPARDRGPARVLPRVDVPRPVDLRLGQAAARPAQRVHVDRPPRHARVELLHPGRQLVDAEPRRLPLQPRLGSRRADRLRRGDVQQGAARDLPARRPGGVHDRRRGHGRRQRLVVRTPPRATASSTAGPSASAPRSRCSPASASPSAATSRARS